MIITVRSTNNKWYGCRGAGVARRQLPVFYCSVTWVITFTLTAHTNPGPAFFSHLQMVRNGYNGDEAATLLRDCDKCDVLSCCDWLWNQCVSLGNVCTPCSYCCFLITAVCCCCCCGVVGAGAGVGVVFVRVNNCCKVSPPRVSRVMGTFIAAFINLHITITTQGRPMCHVISAEKEEIIRVAKNTRLLMQD